MATGKNHLKKLKEASQKLVVLIILDGWGIAPPNKGNAITLAKTPTMDSLIKHYSSTELIAHGVKVGLPPKQDGNSEAGHMNLGSGRVTDQDAVYISKEINNGAFFKNAAFLEAIQNVKKNKSKMHLMGLISGDQSAHAEPDHLLALLELLRQRGINKFYLHLFTDGRDSSRFSGLEYVLALERGLKWPNESIATIQGRFYAMDRKKKWNRLEKAYNLLVLGKGESANSPQAAITRAYNRGESDEFIRPAIMLRHGKPIATIGDNDSVIFFNLRSDRARQFTKAFVQKDFKEGFKRQKILKNLVFVAMTDFGPDLENILTAFPSRDLKNTLPFVLDGLKQLYVAESEKYSHVTYFFNGGYADPVMGEERIRIPSPDVVSYDEIPGMSAAKITETVLEKIRVGNFNFMAVNFCNPDMIGHTGNLSAGIKAVEAVDHCLGKIISAILKKNGTAVVTADHGNIEEMINLKTGEVDTKHSTNPVPLIVVGQNWRHKKLKSGFLADVAPTILKIMGLPKPREMSGDSLF
ncbi:MAG: 2,3-bisphosphoglycerate-independent phosphoglycerate mutase [bacterium]